MTLGQIVSHVLAFLFGAIVGPLVVKYFGDKLTDNGRKQEGREEIADKWQTLVGRMPDLIAEMREDWKKPENRGQTFGSLTQNNDSRRCWASSVGG